MTSSLLLAIAMTTKETQFYKTLGARLAQLRQENGLTQTTLAEHLGIAQQTLAHYESGRLRLPVALLPELSYQFALPVDDILGLTQGKGKRGPAPRLQQQLERLSRLPKAKQQVLMEMIDGVIKQAS
jgi:transcriptional regulator with XRE-family HTH domain